LTGPRATEQKEICYGIFEIFCLNLWKFQLVTVKKLVITENWIGLSISENYKSFVSQVI